MPCANERARADKPVSEYVTKRWPKPILKHSEPPEGVLLSIAYHPGWCEDLTSWVIHLNDDGVLRQAIQWHSRKSDDLEEELQSIELSPESFGQFETLLSASDSEALHAVEHMMCVDDVAMISMRSATRDIRVSLPFLYIEEDLKKGRLTLNAIQQRGFDVFASLWHFADRHASYSLAQHEKSRTRRG
jgi:hypothetical protein